MILDTLDHSSAYAPLGARFALALNFARKFDPVTADGRLSLDGDNVYALVQSYTTTPAAERQFETHRLHADLQFLAAGEEIIQYTPRDLLQETQSYVLQDDCALYTGTEALPLRLQPGCFAILFPQDGHKPGCVWRAPVPVRKVVVKIRL